MRALGRTHQPHSGKDGHTAHHVCFIPGATSIDGRLLLSNCLRSEKQGTVIDIDSVII